MSYWLPFWAGASIDLSAFPDTKPDMTTHYELAGRYYYPASIRVFTALLLAILIFAVIYGSPAVLFIYPLGFYFIFTRGGTEIDFGKKRIRDFQVILWTRLGLWEDLPAIEYISLRKAIEKFGVRSPRVGSFSTHREVKYKVNLIYNKRAYIPVFDTCEHADALKVALELSKASGLRIFAADGKRKSGWL
jgi:hypothetical protein